MRVPLPLLYAVIAAEALLILALTALVVASRARRMRTERAVELRVRPLRPLLLEVAAEDDPAGSSLASLQALGEQDWEALAPSAIGLLAKLRGSSKEAVASLVDAHGSTGKAYRALFSPKARERAEAAEVIGSLGHEELAPRLVPLLGDRRGDVRQVAARSLGLLRHAGGTEALLATASGRNSVPRGVVGHALLRIGPPVVPVLREALSQGDAPQRSLAAELLGRLGALSAAARLAELADEDPELSVRLSSVQSLGRFGLGEWIEPLIRAAGRASPPALREAAVEALGSVGTPEAASALAMLTGDENRRIGARAAACLAALGPLGRAALERAIAGEKSGDERLERAAAQARGALALQRVGESS